ncbi:hypothetical protein ACLKA6_009794 [Drosophila palustris]
MSGRLAKKRRVQDLGTTAAIVDSAVLRHLDEEVAQKRSHIARNYRRASSRWEYHHVGLLEVCNCLEDEGFVLHTVNQSRNCVEVMSEQM